MTRTLDAIQTDAARAKDESTGLDRCIRAIEKEFPEPYVPGNVRAVLLGLYGHMGVLNDHEDALNYELIQAREFGTEVTS